MAPIVLEHAALVFAGIGMALNVYAVFRINQLRTRIRVIPLKPGEALQASALLPLDLGVHPHPARSSCAAPGETAAIDTLKNAGLGDDGHARSGLHPVGKLDLLDVVSEDSGALLIRLAIVERDFGNSHRQVTGVDDLHAPGPNICARDPHRNVGHPEPNGVFPDQPNSVEHTERSAQHRDS